MSTQTDLIAALAAIDAEIDATEIRVADLRLERRGAEALLKRLGFSTTDLPTEKPAPVKGYSAQQPVADGSTFRLAEGNAKYVVEILSTADAAGMSLGTIEKKTVEQGTPLSNDQVRSAVTYLKKKGLAETVTRGMWRLTAQSPGPTNADNPTESVGLSVDSDPTPEGGEHTDGQGSHHDHRIDFDGRNGDRDNLGASVRH